MQNSTAVLDVDLNAIINNYQSLSSRSSSADCAAVIKANAYGLGYEHVAPALYNNTKCNIFFVANLKEAIGIRSILKDAIIYVFNGLFADQIDYYRDNNIRPILNDLTQIELWNDSSHPCAIHFDTGINRLGLSKSETEIFLNKSNNLNISLILSHFIRSNEPDHVTNKDQLQKFKKINDALPDIPASLCNSAGILLGDEYHFDLLRPGIMLYGGNPRALPLPADIGNVFEIKGKILQIRDLNIGETVGYNARWTAKRPSKIALINVGYADGFLGMEEKVALASIRGRRVNIIGKISMDMIGIDITCDINGQNFDNIKGDEEVELIGSNITLEMMSEVSSLGQYELLTSIGHRFEKKYKLGEIH